MAVVAPSSAWVNPCGGLPWRTRSDGTIELQGIGVPSYAPTSSAAKYLTQTWRNWQTQFQSAAKTYGVPVAWLLAIATQETGAWSANPDHQRTIISGDGYGSVGIMQPLPSTAVSMGFSTSDVYDPLKNISIGAKLISKDMARYPGAGFPACAAAFNAGHACGASDAELQLAGFVGSSGAYPRSALTLLNTALGLGLGKPASNPMLYAAAGMLVVGAVGWFWIR